MEYNSVTESSTESDVSDPWSIIDRDSCEPDEIPGDLFGRDSLSGEPSDGESLEVIDEEEKYEEFKEAGMETDGISIISESEICDELEEPIPAAVTKEKKYLHHPNDNLNSCLTKSVVITIIVAACVAYGHLQGLKEECPVVNESTLSLVAKLQKENELLKHTLGQIRQENELLQHRLRKIQIEKDKFSSFSEVENTKSEFKNTAVPHTKPGMNKDHVSVVKTSKVETEYGADEIKFRYNYNPKNPKSGLSNSEGTLKLTDNMNSEHNDIFRLFGQNAIFIEDGNPTLEMAHVNEKDTESQKDDDPDNIITVENEIEDITDNIGRGGDDKLIIQTKKDTETDHEDDGIFVYPPVEDDYTRSTFSLNVGDTLKHILSYSEGYRPTDFYSGDLHETSTNTYSIEDSSLQLIKSTVQLLKMHFDNDVMSADTGSIISSAFTLLSEHEDGLIQLQKNVRNCQISKSEFCNQHEKKMEITISKLKETTENLVEDIDEQMYKVLIKIVRRLRKFKGNLQNKWCYMKNKCNSDGTWLEAAVLLDCKEKEKRNKKEFSWKECQTKNKQPIINLVSGKPVENVKEKEINMDFKYFTDKFSDSGKMYKNNNKNKENTPYKKTNKFSQYGKNEKYDNYEKKQEVPSGKKVLKKFEKYQNYWVSKQLKNGYKDNGEKYWSNKNYDKGKQTKENHYEKYVIMDQKKTWPTFNSDTKHNVSGEWMVKMANGRAEQRKLSHKSDWLFDRADARKMKREKHYQTSSWYFQRAQEREYCRYYPHSEKCKTGNNEGRMHRASRWSRKFMSGAIARVGKWMKESLPDFKNKFNSYYSHH